MIADLLNRLYASPSYKIFRLGHLGSSLLLAPLCGTELREERLGARQAPCSRPGRQLPSEARPAPLGVGRPPAVR